MVVLNIKTVTKAQKCAKNRSFSRKSKQRVIPSLGKWFYFDVYRHLSCKNHTNIGSTNNEYSENAITSKHVFETSWPFSACLVLPSFKNTAGTCTDLQAECRMKYFWQYLIIVINWKYVRRRSICFITAPGVGAFHSPTIACSQASNSSLLLPHIGNCFRFW